MLEFLKKKTKYHFDENNTFQVIPNKLNTLIGSAGSSKTKYLIDKLNTEWKDRKILFIGLDHNFSYDLYKSEMAKFETRPNCKAIHFKAEYRSNINLDEYIGLDGSIVNDFDLLIVDEAMYFKKYSEQILNNNITKILVFSSKKEENLFCEIK